jgi:hypothetical protein
MVDAPIHVDVTTGNPKSGKWREGKEKEQKEQHLSGTPSPRTLKHHHDHCL